MLPEWRSVSGTWDTLSVMTTTTSAAALSTPVTPPHPRYTGPGGARFQAEKVQDEALDRIGVWVGAEVHRGTGLRVPTLNGVEPAFIGDYIVKDERGIVYIYQEDSFADEFTKS